jgi:hypothetical protein
VLVIFRSFKQPTEWEKTFTRFSSGKTFISIMYKELKKANTKRINNPMTKGQILNRQFSKEEVEVASKYMKKCSTSLAIRELGINLSLRFRLTPFRLVSSRKQTTNTGEDLS